MGNPPVAPPPNLIPPIAGGSTSANIAGVDGFNSGGGVGVHGTSTQFDAVVGETDSDAHAGVTGRNNTTGANGGVGVYGIGGIFAGKFDGALLVTGNATFGRDLAVSWNVSASDLEIKAAASIGGNLSVAGECYCAKTLTVAEDVILSNADCAEELDVRYDTNSEPGTVMVLDHRGLLEESRCPYDRRVAGVISGAGELKPALILGRDESSVDTHRRPVALVGKVYCKVDAQYAPITVGDLLTTSDTAGHAMKAADPTRAFGAVIGKALKALSKGRGLIPVLVALQ
jgi:hypothetical protein